MKKLLLVFLGIVTTGLTQAQNTSELQQAFEHFNKLKYINCVMVEKCETDIMCHVNKNCSSKPETTQDDEDILMTTTNDLGSIGLGLIAGSKECLNNPKLCQEFINFLKDMPKDCKGFDVNTYIETEDFNNQLNYMRSSQLNSCLYNL